jgi:HigB_toxin, RelE-like toxic component of a toxin-antitoxin system
VAAIGTEADARIFCFRHSKDSLICGLRIAVMLITEINYRFRRVYIRHVLSHAQYDQEKWKR